MSCHSISKCWKEWKKQELKVLQSWPKLQKYRSYVTLWETKSVVLRIGQPNRVPLVAPRNRWKPHWWGWQWQKRSRTKDSERELWKKCVPWLWREMTVANVAALCQQNQSSLFADTCWSMIWSFRGLSLNSRSIKFDKVCVLSGLIGIA